jgi:hypothetical protein
MRLAMLRQPAVAFWANTAEITDPARPRRAGVRRKRMLQPPIGTGQRLRNALLANWPSPASARRAAF